MAAREDTMGALTRYFRLQLMLRRFVPLAGLYYRLSSWLALTVSPLRGEREQYLRWWRRVGVGDTERRWREYVRLSGRVAGMNFRYPDFGTGRFSFTQDDPHGVLPLARRRGVLILTYHHHLAYPLGVTLGLHGVALNAMAMDPRGNPLFQRFPEFSERIFEDSEKFFGGGRWVFVRPGASNTLMAPLRELSKGVSLVSLHDFDNPFQRSASEVVSLFGGRLRAPVGVLSYAAARGIPVAIGYLLEESRRDTFRLVLRLISAPDTETTADQLLRRYFAHLEEIVRETPEFWNQWPRLSEAPPPNQEQGS